MRMLFASAIVAFLAPTSPASVWTTVYRCDETTPLEAIDPNRPAVYRDIMVGTRLVIVVSSDIGGFWEGSLYTTPEDAQYGVLTGRGFLGRPPNYQGSCLEAAGKRADVLATFWEEYRGFDLATDTGVGGPSYAAVAGDWFVVDYHAEQCGSCDVMLFDYASADGAVMLRETLSFRNVPTRDFNNDAVVNFADFSLLSAKWRQETDSIPEDPNSGLDLNSDHRVDVADLVLFSDYWLERADCVPTPADPNEPVEKP